MDGWPALSIHGDKSQAERDWVLSEFKAGKSPIMTATDVAARGLGMFRKAICLNTCVLVFQKESRHFFFMILDEFYVFLFCTHSFPSQLPNSCDVWDLKVVVVCGLPSHLVSLDVLSAEVF